MHSINRSLLALLATLSIWDAPLSMDLQKKSAEANGSLPRPLSPSRGRGGPSSVAQQDQSTISDALQEKLRIALEQVHAEDRKSVAAAAQRLIRDNMSGYDIRAIISALQEVPALSS